jgi:16S rRNA G1207 methylase RsmC
MATRLAFDTVGSMLDVGCGVGHWGRVLSSVLPASTRFTGVDREQRWVRDAAAAAEHAGLALPAASCRAMSRHFLSPTTRST